MDRDQLAEHLAFAKELGVTGISRDPVWRQRAHLENPCGDPPTPAEAIPVPVFGTSAGAPAAEPEPRPGRSRHVRAVSVPTDRCHQAKGDRGIGYVCGPGALADAGSDF